MRSIAKKDYSLKGSRSSGNLQGSTAKPKFAIQKLNQNSKSIAKFAPQKNLMTEFYAGAKESSNERVGSLFKMTSSELENSITPLKSRMSDESSQASLHTTIDKRQKKILDNVQQTTSFQESTVRLMSEHVNKSKIIEKGIFLPKI